MFWFKGTNQANALSGNVFVIVNAQACQALMSSQAQRLATSQLAAPYGTRFLTGCYSTIQSVRNQQLQRILNPLNDWLWQSKQRQHEKNNANQCIAIRGKSDRDH